MACKYLISRRFYFSSMWGTL